MDRMFSDLIEHMSGFVSERRLEVFQKVLGERTRYITVLLEDIYQAQNASAVMRTCECLGIQDVHVVEESNEYEVNPDITVGSDLWLSINHYNSGKALGSEMHNRRPDRKGGIQIRKAINALKEQGYRIVATSPHKDGITPETFDLEKGKAAFMFGTELEGLTDLALDLADEFIQIPMIGFTESYNISVSAAVIMYTLRKRLEQSSIDWRIGEEEHAKLMLDWLRGSIKLGKQIEDKFLSEYVDTF
ncbi:MAG: RNA methyltransferase [Bacteroides sp.]|nr:RNA methyltransferase [Bacteroides sp.]